jgi:hypothetical protein
MLRVCLVSLIIYSLPSADNAPNPVGNFSQHHFGFCVRIKLGGCGIVRFDAAIIALEIFLPLGIDCFY